MSKVTGLMLVENNTPFVFDCNYTYTSYTLYKNTSYIYLPLYRFSTWTHERKEMYPERFQEHDICILTSSMPWFYESLTDCPCCQLYFRIYQDLLTPELEIRVTQLLAGTNTIECFEDSLRGSLCARLAGWLPARPSIHRACDGAQWGAATRPARSC